MKISVIIPAYNESQAIRQTLSDLCAHKELQDAEIIVVNDGSTDDTGKIVAEFPRVILIEHHANKGYGASISSAARVATQPYILWFDSDGQHRVEDLIKVARNLEEKNLDYCIGVRDENSFQEPNRKLGKRILAVAIRFIAGQPVRDYNSGLRGFKREVLVRYLHLLPKGFGASTITTVLMLERGYRGDEVLITVNKRLGKSSVRQVRDGFGTLYLLLRLFLLFKPMQFFGSMGGFMVVLGLVYGFYRALNDKLGFPVLGLVIVIFGVQTLFFGLISDQVSALRRERFE
jgi:glycosyltransferase involved in cell wall biosynthesis